MMEDHTEKIFPDPPLAPAQIYPTAPSAPADTAIPTIASMPAASDKVSSRSSLVQFSSCGL